MHTNNDRVISQSRAGDYLTQIGGYRAFVPKPLPPDPPIQLDNEMLQLLSQADRELGRLDGASEILPNVDLFVAMYVNKEAVLSSQIEGTQASLIDVLAFEADAALPDNPQDIEEATTTARKIVQLREQHRNIIATHFPRLGGTYQLLEYLYQRPVITVNGATRVTGLSYANANRLIMKFQEYGLLRQMDTFQRNRRFIYADYLAMFSDEETPKDGHEETSAREEEKTDYLA